MILVLERRLEEFSRSIENRLLSIEDQIIGACDTYKKSNNMSDNGFCLDLLRNWVADLERQVSEKDAIISFLSKQLINKNRYGDSCNGTTVNDNNGSFHERTKTINNNFLLGQDNKKDKSESVIIVGDSMLNNINSRGLPKSKKVSVSNHPSVTNEDIPSAVEESLKTNPDTLIVHASTDDLTKSINTLEMLKEHTKK